jgi:2-methylcitrate dehydratase PrpD
MRHAFGIAYAQAAGNRQCILDGALTKRLQAGQAASAGVLSALLARRGFTGAHEVFEGKFGFFELYQPNGADPSLLTAELGAAYRGEGLSFKPYPCGRPLNAAIDAALAARAALGIGRADDIAAATIVADAAGHRDQFQAGPIKRRPTQVVQAQFAQPFLVSCALALGRVGIRDVDRHDDPAVLALADRIEGEALDGAPKGHVAIRLRHRDGRTVEVAAVDPTGSPSRPMPQAQFEAKFRDNAANARVPIAGAAVDRLLAMLRSLDELPDVRVLAEAVE